jgi:NAD(P)-dependent dehydrogenase (short-subunit alcohol dehydrogenase family)
MSSNSGKIDMSLKGKTIFITGASRGIGLAIALRSAPLSQSALPSLAQRSYTSLVCVIAGRQRREPT